MGCYANTCPRPLISRSTAQRSCAHPTEPQRTTSQDARIYDTIRDVRRGRCVHRLNPPSQVVGDSHHAPSSNPDRAAVTSGEPRWPLGQKMWPARQADTRMTPLLGQSGAVPT